MDIKVTAAKIADRFISFFGKSKTIKQISTEIGEAADNELLLLWGKVKPWLIEEYQEDTPIEDDFEAADVKALLKKQLKNADEATKAAIEKALAQQPNLGSGSKVINNNSKIGQQNINSTVNNDGTTFTL